MNNDSKFHTRKVHRLADYDYSKPGAYFLTICTKNHLNYFWDGEIDTHKLTWMSVGTNCVRLSGLPLSEIGTLVSMELEKWHVTYESVLLHSYVIMPDHIHLIVAIMPETHGRTQFVPTVDRMVKQFKGAISKRVGFPVWQNSFYDHVIRSRDDYHECTQYIINNPLRYYYRNINSHEDNK